MASQILISSIYSGQMLWAFCSPCPYWPSIVCASDSGEIKNTKNSRKASVHVKCCANRKGHWVQLDNLFEFNGYESYLVKKRSMKAILSDDEFNKAFGTTNNEDWRKAIVEATFVMNKDVDSRLDTVNILDEINFEFSKIASNIHFEDETSPQPSKIAEQPKRRSTYNLRRSELPQQPPPLPRANRQSTRRSLPATTTTSKKLSKFEEFEKELSEYEIHSFEKEKLFHGIQVGNLCKICCSTDHGKDGNLVKCSACGDHVHRVCLNDNNNNDESFIQLPDLLDLNDRMKRSSIRIRLEPKKVLCNECQSSSICFACKEVDAGVPLKQCDVRSCSRHYHVDCLDHWKQIEIVDSKLKCPLHVCHTCYSTSNDQLTMKFTFCVKCPTVYHINSCCIPAGTIILTQKHHICIRHRCESRRNLPTLDWCVRCGKEGDTLVCCGSCPKTYHVSCLGSSEVPHPFSCRDCVSGRNPLYGEMVIAKYFSHPWWPAVIVPPHKIPEHMYGKPPNDHEFCIRFFGDYRFGWIGRNAVYSYSKKEKNKFLSDDPQQLIAFTEASNWYDKMDRKNNNEPLISLKAIESQPLRQPSHYVKITTINIVAPAKPNKLQDEPVKCSCTSSDACGPTSNCENRELCIECDPKHCPNGSNCKNQCFERKVYAAVKVVFTNEKKGFGLIAEESIDAGTLVIEYVGELITENELLRRKSRKESKAGPKHVYFMTYAKGLYLDADRKGNESRFINHSCDPNCQTRKWTVNRVDRIGYFALKDIEKGTELTTNYDFDRGDVHQCFCGAKNCRGVIGSRNAKK